MRRRVKILVGVRDLLTMLIVVMDSRVNAYNRIYKLLISTVYDMSVIAPQNRERAETEMIDDR